MIQVMDPDFEAVIGQPVAKSRRHGIRAFGDEIERGTKAQLHFQLSQFLDAIESSLAFDIVGQHKCKLPSLRPTLPTLRRPFGAGHDWPDIPNPLPLALHEPPPNTQSNGLGNQWLKAKIEAIEEHARKS